MKNFPEAESFLETAYKRAENSPGFQTFQIDTYALKLLLRIEELSSSKDVIRFEQILAKSELVLSMVNRRRHFFLDFVESHFLHAGPNVLAAKRSRGARAAVFGLDVEQPGILGRTPSGAPGVTVADLLVCPALPRKIFRLTRRANQWLKPARLTR